MNAAAFLFAQLAVNRRDDEDGCSYWMAELRQGYPSIDIAGERLAVHRLVAAIWWGPAAVADCDVHHICEHKACINPMHLVPLSPGDHRRVHAGTMVATPRDTPACDVNFGECFAVSRARPARAETISSEPAPAPAPKRNPKPPRVKRPEREWNPGKSMSKASRALPPLEVSP